MEKIDVRVFLICLFAFFLAIPAQLLAKASYVVAPGVIEFDLNSTKRQTKSFLIRNTGDERIRLSIQPIFFKVNSKNLNIGEPLNPETDEDFSLIPHLRLSPPIVSLVPQQRRTIRVSVRPTAKLLPGDYRTHVLIKIVSRQPMGNKVESAEQASGVNLNLDLQIETAISLVARVGNPEFKMSWECQRKDDGYISLMLSNQSQWRFKGWAAVYLPDQLGQENQLPTGDPLELLSIIAYRETKRDYLIKDPDTEGVLIFWGLDKSQLNIGKAFCEIKP